MAPNSDGSFGAVYLTRANATRFLVNTGLPLSPTTLDYWAVKGIGPKFRIVNGRAVYRRVDLESYLREDTAPAAA